jgi:sec-independent protein translocase protein TatA
MLGNIGSGELIIIGMVVLLFFGSKKLKELGKGLGQTSREFKKIKDEIEGGEDNS